MGDVAVVVMALAAAAGAWASVRLPLLPVVAVAVVGVATRRPVLVIVGAALVASALGARAEAGLRPPTVGQWRGTATLVGDPADAFGGVRVDVRIGGKRVEAQARGRAAARLRPRLAGEQVSMAGRAAAGARLGPPLPVPPPRRGPPGGGRGRRVGAGQRSQPPGQRHPPHPAGRAWRPCRPTGGRSTPGSSWATTGASRSRSPTTSGPPGSPTCWW